MTKQWFAVIDSASGELLSEGTVVADEETLTELGRVAIPVDGPSEGRPWDAQERRHGPRPPDERAERRQRADEKLAAAKKSGATQGAKIDAILALLEEQRG